MLKQILYFPRETKNWKVFPRRFLCSIKKTQSLIESSDYHVKSGRHCTEARKRGRGGGDCPSCRRRGKPNNGADGFWGVGDR